MKKYVALFDWDDTVQKYSVMDRWVKLLVSEGLMDEKIHEVYKPIVADYKEGLIDNNSKTERGLTVLGEYMEGIEVSESRSLYYEFRNKNDGFINRLIIDKLFPFLKENGVDIIVISGSPEDVLKLYQKEFNIDEIYAMKYDVLDGKYLSTFPINTGIGSGKQKFIDDIVAKDKEILFAFGDSVSDIPLLKSAKYSFVNSNKNFLDKENIYYLDFWKEEDILFIVEKIKEAINS